MSKEIQPRSAGRITHSILPMTLWDIATALMTFCTIHLYQDLMQYWHQLIPNRIYDLDYKLLTEDQKKKPAS